MHRQITIRLSVDQLARLDYLCAHNHRSRSDQIARWVDGTVSGEVVDTPVYRYEGWTLDLTDEQAAQVMAEYDGPPLFLDGAGTIKDGDGNVIGTIPAAEAEAIRNGAAVRS